MSTSKITRKWIIWFSLLFASASATAQQSMMVTGDSISAGYERPSYRQPLLDAFAAANCSVDMVGNQTLNSFDYRNPQSRPGSHFPGFAPIDGYDTDHQAFPAIQTQSLVNGISTSAYTVLPIGSYLAAEQPDYVLVHSGTNDLNAAIKSGVDTDA